LKEEKGEYGEGRKAVDKGEHGEEKLLSRQSLEKRSC